MQFGHRTQNASRDKNHRHRTPPLAALGAAGNDRDAAPLSASWQAAEAAFAAPALRPAPPQQALITVRRSRGTLPAPAATAADEAVGSGVDGKGPRVFRVEAAQPPRPADATDAADAAHADDRDSRLLAPHPAALALSSKPAAPAFSRSRQAAADKAPGPVLHVVHMVHTPPAQRVIETPAQRIATLSAKLAAVGPVLDAIQRAQSLCFIDDSASQAWQRLSQECEAVGQGIRAQLR